MMMRENLQDIYRLLTQDETLLRLLYYKPSNYNDNPLDKSKQNILDMEESEKWKIIQDRIVTTIKTSGLDKEKKCRILFYPGKRHSTGNYLISSQLINFDVLVHIEFDEIDMRLSWICDHLNELLFKNRITGVGKISFVDGDKLLTPDEYVGYRLIYRFGSVN